VPEGRSYATKHGQGWGVLVFHYRIDAGRLSDGPTTNRSAPMAARRTCRGSPPQGLPRRSDPGVNPYRGSTMVLIVTWMSLSSSPVCGCGALPHPLSSNA
jgi:hypothetical protein